MTELGGGPGRVEQRLRSTLAWCRSPESPALRVDSLPEQIAADHYRYRQQLGGTASAHHRRHHDRVRACLSELRPPQHLRRSLIKQATALVERARRINLQNISNQKNRTRPTGEWRQNFLAADARARSREAAGFRRDTIQALERLRQAGWLVDAITITLPPGFHPKSSHCFGLAGSPSSQDAADTLRRLWAGSKPGPGFWRLEEHADGTIHMHSMVAYPSARDRLAHHERLRRSYLRETYRGWSLSVAGGFGLTAPPWECWRFPLHIDTMRDTEHLIQTVRYITKRLCPLVSTLPGRSRGVTGKLLADAQLSQQKVGRIKNYQGGPRVSPRPAPHAQPAPQPIARPRVSSCPRESVVAWCRPPARAPPENGFQIFCHWLCGPAPRFSRGWSHLSQMESISWPEKIFLSKSKPRAPPWLAPRRVSASMTRAQKSSLGATFSLGCAMTTAFDKHSRPASPSGPFARRMPMFWPRCSVRSPRSWHLPPCRVSAPSQMRKSASEWRATKPAGRT